MARILSEGSRHVHGYRPQNNSILGDEELTAEGATATAADGSGNGDTLLSLSSPGRNHPGLGSISFEVFLRAVNIFFCFQVGVRRARVCCFWRIEGVFAFRCAPSRVLAAIICCAAITACVSLCVDCILSLWFCYFACLLLCGKCRGAYHY